MVKKVETKKPVAKAVKKAPMEANIRFTPDDVEAYAKKDRMEEGLYQFLVTGSQSKVSDEKKHLMLVLSCRVLATEGDAASAKGYAMKRYVCLPLRNTEEPGHQPNEKFGGMALPVFKALIPDQIPEMPRWENKKLYFKGKEISADEEAAARKEVMETVCEVSSVLYDNGGPELAGCGFYAYLTYPETGDFPEIKGWYAERPKDKNGNVVPLATEE